MKILCVSYFLSSTITIFSALTFSLISLGSAQTPNNIKRQIPTNKAALKNQTEFLSKNVPAAPLPIGSKNLDFLRDRAVNLQKQQAVFLEDLSTGKVTTFPDLVKARPQHIKDVASLIRSINEVSNEKEPRKRETLSDALFVSLQPLGILLKDANYVDGYQNRLSTDQATELKRLEAAWDDAAVNHPSGSHPLTIVSPAQLYTLTYLRVPLTVKGKPNSTILFRAQAGGLFSNNLDIIEKKTDKDGIAIAYWTTQGDATADCPIDLRSPSAPTDGTSINITTVKPALRPLPNQPNLPAAP